MDRTREMGLELRKRRKDSGMSVDELAARTRISARYIDWLEEGDLENLPGGVFVSGFIRTICNEIGCDADRLLEMLEPEEEEEVAEEPVAETKKPIPLLLTAGVLALLVVGAFLIAGGDRERKTPEAEKPAATEEASPTPASESGTEAIISPGEETLPEDLDLVIRAIDKTWLKIQTDDQEPWETTMKPGDEVRLKAMEKVSLFIGNAGGLVFELNGRTFGPPGAKGQVISNYVVTRDNL